MEIATHVKTEAIEQLSMFIISEAARFQQRAKATSKTFAKNKRRYVAGFREILKCLKSRSSVPKIIFISRSFSLEFSDDLSLYKEVVQLCSLKNVSIVFVGSRSALAKALHDGSAVASKTGGNSFKAVSAVALISLDGLYEKAAELKELVTAAHIEWKSQFLRQESSVCLWNAIFNGYSNDFIKNSLLESGKCLPVLKNYIDPKYGRTPLMACASYKCHVSTFVLLLLESFIHASNTATDAELKDFQGYDLFHCCVLHSRFEYCQVLHEKHMVTFSTAFNGKNCFETAVTNGDLLILKFLLQHYSNFCTADKIESCLKIAASCPKKGHFILEKLLQCLKSKAAASEKNFLISDWKTVFINAIDCGNLHSFRLLFNFYDSHNITMKFPNIIVKSQTRALLEDLQLSFAKKFSCSEVKKINALMLPLSQA